MGLNANRFKDGSEYDFNLESDLENENKKAAQIEAIQKNNERTEESQIQGTQTSCLLDLMINKQSFSANPRDIKRNSSNQAGSEPGENFLQILKEYTQEQDMKHQNQMVHTQLRQSNEALSKECHQLKDELAAKDKLISDLEIKVKYEKI